MTSKQIALFCRGLSLVAGVVIGGFSLAGNEGFFKLHLNSIREFYV